ncbi:hypothetical protein ABIB42_004575 [Massilia sp. UYP32]
MGFLVVITSVMEQSFRDYFMTPFHTEILTGSIACALGPDSVGPRKASWWRKQDCP